MAAVRPIYETETDISREAGFAGVIQSAWNCHMIKQPKMVGVDYALAKASGIISAFCEIKCRTNPRLQYPTYMISAGKKLTADALSNSLGVPVILAIRWADCAGYVVLNELKAGDGFQLRSGGRRDRGDPQDIEAVCLIPVSLFRPIRVSG